MATTSELIASGEMLLDDNGHYIILQQHVSDGTLIIDTEDGYFKLGESIEFNPNPVGTLVTKADAGLVPPDDPTAGDIIALDASLAGRPLLSQYDLDGPGPDQGYDPAAFGIGFFAAIAIPADDVSVDLNDYTLEQSEEHALLQRFYANIELASAPFIPGQGPHDFGSTFDPANNVTILNGTLGLSSHHGIHGNRNENVTIQNTTWKVRQNSPSGSSARSLISISAQGALAIFQAGISSSNTCSLVCPRANRPCTRCTNCPRASRVRV